MYRARVNAIAQCGGVYYQRPSGSRLTLSSSSARPTETSNSVSPLLRLVSIHSSSASAADSTVFACDATCCIRCGGMSSLPDIV
jgi:hypothetical protein